MGLWRKVLALLAAGALALSLGACGGPGEEQSGGAAASTPGDAMEGTDMAGRSVAIPAGADRFACIGPGCLRLYCYVGEQSQLAGVEDVEKTWGETGRPYAMALGDVEGLAAIGPGGPGSAPDAERLLASGADVVEFLIYTGALSSGKKLTVGIYTSAEAGGGSPEKVGDAEFTATGAEPGLAVVSYRVQGGRGRYVGVSFQHDASAGVDCAVAAVVRPAYRPPEDGWKLVV